LVFVDKLWPDFDKDDLAASILEYQQRNRRYGAAAESG
jgi:undecaprenyl diphosphate synthase